MTAPDTASQASPSTGTPFSWRDGLAVYLQPRVLILLFTGFSFGLTCASYV